MCPLRAHPSQLGVMIDPKLSEAYKISSRLLGQGAFGMVYAGTEVATNTPVAVKLCRYQSKQHLTEYIREADNLKAAAHPNVVRLLASAVDAAALTGTMIFELCCMDLRHMLWRHHDFLPCWLADRFRMHMFSGAACLHRVGIIHRDIKPGNLLVDLHHRTGPCLKLSDLGSSRRVGNAFRGMHMTPGLTTPWYCAPEACKQQLQAPRSTGSHQRGLRHCTGEGEREVTGMREVSGREESEDRGCRS